MAISTYVGSFNIDTSKTIGQTQSITGVGFTPKVVIFWWSGTTATSDGARGSDHQVGIGTMVSGTQRWASASFSVDNKNMEPTTGRTGTPGWCIVEFNKILETPTLIGEADYYSFDSDGFTIVMDAQFSTALRVSYLAIGGDEITNVAAGYGAAPVDGSEDYTVGFRPDFVLVAGQGQTTGVYNAIYNNIGMASSSSLGNQGTVAYYANAGQLSVTDRFRYGYGGEIWADPFTPGVNELRCRAYMSYVSSTYFRLTATEYDYSSNRLYYLAIKGGSWSVGSLTTSTSTSATIEVDTGFIPKAIFMLSANMTVSTQDTVSDHYPITIGAATSTTNRATQAAWDEDALSTSEVSTANYDTAVYASVKNDAIDGLMDIDSIDASGFTCIMDDGDSVASWVLYAALGYPPASSSKHAYMNGGDPYQYANPSTDEEISGWTDENDGTTDIYLSISDSSDETYIKSKGEATAHTYITKLSALSAIPQTYKDHYVNISVQKDYASGTEIDLTVTLYCFDDIVATWTYENVGNEWSDKSELLTWAQATAIANHADGNGYANLYLKFVTQEAS